MGDVPEALMGERAGRSSVRPGRKRLDEAVTALRTATVYLYLDATFFDAR